jgi:hypothetical protein
LIDSEKVIMNVQARYTVRNIDVEGIHIDVVAPPGDGLPIACDEDAGEFANRTGYGVSSWNPFGCGKGKCAGLNGNFNLGVKQLPRCIGQVGRNGHRSHGSRCVVIASRAVRSRHSRRLSI